MRNRIGFLRPSEIEDLPPPMEFIENGGRESGVTQLTEEHLELIGRIKASEELIVSSHYTKMKKAQRAAILNNLLTWTKLELQLRKSY